MSSNTPMTAQARIKSGIYCKKPCEQCGTIHNRKRFCSLKCKLLWWESMADETKSNFRSKRIEFDIKDSDCWEVVSHKPNKVTGYPQVRLNGCGTSAHRYVYKVFVGEIEDGLVVRHTCDNPMCINPDHLELGTIAENSADCVSRGRTARGEGNPWARLNEQQVLEIFTSQESQAATARKFGVSDKAVWSIRHGVTWSWLTGVKNER